MRKEANPIINKDTGEVIDEIRPGDRILRAESIDHLSSMQEWKIEHFYKGNLPEIRMWLKDLTLVEKGVLFSVSPYISYEDCCLKHDNGAMVKFDDIVEISGASRGAVSTALNSLIEKDIIYRGKNSKERQYFVNPWLFCKGNRINTVLKTMFRNYKIRVLGGKQWKNVKKSDL